MDRPLQCRFEDVRVTNIAEEMSDDLVHVPKHSCSFPPYPPICKRHPVGGTKAHPSFAKCPGSDRAPEPHSSPFFSKWTKKKRKGSVNKTPTPTSSLKPHVFESSHIFRDDLDADTMPDYLRPPCFPEGKYEEDFEDTTEYRFIDVNEVFVIGNSNAATFDPKKIPPNLRMKIVDSTSDSADDLNLIPKPSCDIWKTSTK